MIQPNLIFDIGMHTGRDTEFYLKKGFNVVSVEANPKLAEKGKEKFKNEIQTEQLHIIDKAINDTVGAIDFFIFENKDDWGTTSTLWNRTMDSNVTAIKVETVLLESLLEKYGTPYYMKIDIEGADILCLKSLLKQKEHPTYISIELLTPNNLGTNVDALDILCHLKVLGYNKFLISDQSKNGLLKCPNPSFEGQYTNFIFDGETSGLFGKELQGDWLGIDEVSMKYLDYFYGKSPVKQEGTSLLKKFRKSPEKSETSIFHPNGWFDVHAKIERQS